MDNYISTGMNPMKMAKCIVELERIYGVRNGSAGISHTDNLNEKTQKDLAKQLDISQQQLQDYKKLNELIPELQTLVETNLLKGTTAYMIWFGKNMPKVAVLISLYIQSLHNKLYTIYIIILHNMI